MKYSKSSQKASIFKPKELLPTNPDGDHTEMHTMNLEEIEILVNDGSYDNNYWSFIKDVTLALNFVRDNNNVISLMHKKALELKLIFVSKMNDWMSEKGYCCGKFYVHYAKEVQCSANKECVVEDNDTFYRCNDFTFCSKHFQPFNNLNEIQLNDEV